MNKILTLSFLLFLPLIIEAQDYLASPEFNQFWHDLKRQKLIEGKPEIKYSGTPYLFESDKSTLQLKGGQLIENLTLRYNVYDDVMEIKKEGVFYTIPKEKLFPQIILDEHHFFLKVYKETNKKQTGYFESVVIDSLCSLFIRHNIFLQEATEPKAYQDAKPATFISKSDDLFISFEDDVLVPIKNKNDVIELAPQYQTELSAFIKKNKIKFKKPESVKQLVEYYNSL